MIADAINSALAEVWAKIAYYLTFSFIDPFWHWVPLAAGIIAAVVVVCWFFGGWLKFLRPLGGGIVLIVLSMLYAFRRGEKEAREHDSKKRRKR